MFSHVTIGADDYPRARAFYDAVLATLGIARSQEWPEEGWAVYGTTGAGPTFWIARPHDRRPARPGNGIMPGFAAADAAAVHAFHAAALANGGTCEGPPGPRHDGRFHAAYVRDPEGNKLCALFNPPPQAG